MAESGITLHTGAASTGAAPVGAGKRSSTSRPAEAKSVVDYLGLAACASKLRQDGETFVNNIVAEAAKYDLEFKVTKILGDNYEARVFSCNGNAIALIFHETFVRREMNHIPSVSVTKDVIRQLELKGCSDKIISVIVVLKEMYENYERVVAGMVNSFRAEDGVTFKDLSIQDFNASGELHVSTNLKEVLSFAEATTGSPLAYADSGILIYAKRRDPNKSGYGIGDDTVMTPILAVTGFTDLKRVSMDMFNAQVKYNPTFVISGVYSPIRTREMAALAVAAASDVFVVRKQWLNAFSSFADGERNLGNLFIDQSTKKPYKCKNIMDRQNMMTQHFTSDIPLLAIDLQEGCDQFPGLKDFIDNPESLKAAIKSFSGGTNCEQFEVSQGDAVQYDGIVETAKGRVDTRAVDFLFLVDPKGGGVSHERAAAFLDLPDPTDPRAIEKKAAQLEEFYNKIDLCYTTHRLFFNPDFVGGLSADLSSSINLTIDSWVNNQVYDFSNFKRFGANLGAAFSAGGVGGGWQGIRGFAY